MAKTWQSNTAPGRGSGCALLAGLLGIAITLIEPSAVRAEEPQPVSQEDLAEAKRELDEARAKLDEAQAKVDEATEFAKAGRHPGEEHLMSDVWADGGSAWRN